MANGNGKTESFKDQKEYIALLEKELADMKAKASQPHTVTVKATDKGGVAVYGLGRFPVTLYPSQWMALIKSIGLVMNCIAMDKRPNGNTPLAYKGDEQHAAVKAWVESNE